MDSGLPLSATVTPHCAFCHLPVPARSHAPPPGDPLYCCYGCRFAAHVTRAGGEEGQATWLVTRLGVSVFLTMGVMVFSLALYSRDLYGIGPETSSPLAGALLSLAHYALLLLATPVFLLLGLPIISSALDDLRWRIASTDGLVIIGVAAAFIYSYISTLTGSGSVYYETACMILILITLGRYLEATAKLKAAGTMEDLRTLIPDEVLIRREGRETIVPAADVRPGDRLIVLPGARIAADGLIQTGRAHVDEQIVTGESTPTEKGPGHTVYGGTLCIDGRLEVAATAVGSDHALARLLTLLEEARRARSRYERLADRVAAIFIPLVVTLAVLGAVLGYQRAGTDEAIMTALAVLLISCPCALGIATPMAMWVALGHAARRGILFRSAETLELLATVRAIAVDKTGTLTTGSPTVDAIIVADSHRADPDVPALVAALAAASTHPLGRATAEHLRSRGVAPVPIDDPRSVPGRGMAGRSRGQAIAFGSRALLAANGMAVPADLAAELERAEQAGQSLALCGSGDHVVAIVAFSETLREDAPLAIQGLRRRVDHVIVLTGDHPGRAVRLADQLGVEVRASLLPEDKVHHIREMQRAGRGVAMLGDGLNDAPALASADVGIALGCGAELTREAGDVCLLSDELRAVPETLELAHRTVRTIRGNLTWAFGYNAIGIALAITGILNPVLAAIAMVLSSLFVVVNSLRLNTGPGHTRDGLATVRRPVVSTG